jgi:hypothetical protein
MESKCRMTSECKIGRDIEGTAHGVIKLISSHFLDGLRKTTKMVIKDSRFWAETLTNVLQNTKGTMILSGIC